MPVPRTKTNITGFGPILPPQPKVLVLGSMPSVASLAKHEYYGHPANAFWPIMAKVIGFPCELNYAERTQALREAGVALWDVLHACERKGSSDAAIVADSERANTIDELLHAHRTIRAVFLNGGKAFAAFQKHIAPKLNDAAARQLHIARLPSTSPANASMSRNEKLKHWSRAFQRALGAGENTTTVPDPARVA